MENYYEVDGVLTTKLEQVDTSTKVKVLPRCTDDGAVAGKGGVHYLKHGAFCLETQKYPDAVNHVNICTQHKFPIFEIFIFHRRISHRQFLTQDKFTSMKSFSNSESMSKQQ